LGWELLASFFVPNPIPVWLCVNRIWFALDLLVAYTAVRYGRAKPMAPRIRQYFYWLLAGAFVIGLVGQKTYIHTFQDAMGFEIAFLICLVMSILFIIDHLTEPTHDGATYGIAWAKLCGNLGVSIQCYFLFPIVNQAHSFAFFHFLFVTIFALDGTYLYLLWKARAEEEHVFNEADASLFGPPSVQPGH
jgi:hypothetical protein